MTVEEIYNSVNPMFRHTGILQYDGCIYLQFDVIMLCRELYIVEKSPEKWGIFYANSCANTHPFRGGMIAGCQS